MIAVIKKDASNFIASMKGQDALFYLGCFYVMLHYLRPQYIYPQLDFLPWMRLTILAGLFAMVAANRLKLTAGHFFAIGFLLFAWLSSIYSLYPHISSNLTAPPIFFLELLFLACCVKNIQQFKLILVIFFLFIFKMSFFGARVWASRGFGFADWGIAGPPGFFNNSGEFSLLIAIAFVLAVPFIVAMKPRTIFYWVLPLTAAMTVLGANSRGSQLALVVGCVYLLLAYRKVKFQNVMAVALFSSFVWFILPEEQKERFSSAGDDGTSTARLIYWEAGIDMAKNNPLLGVGYGTFPEHFHNYYRGLDDRLTINRREVAHNSLVEVSSTLGIPALIFYILMHLAIIKKEKPKKHHSEADQEFMMHLSRALTAATIVYFVGAFFMSIAFYPYIYFLLSLRVMLYHCNKETFLSRKVKKYSQHGVA